MIALFQKYAFLIKAFVWVLPFFLLHYVLFAFGPFKEDYANFVFPIPIVYLLFWVFTKTILIALDYVSKKSMAQVGYLFLFLTTFKAILVYVIFLEIINDQHELEKNSLIFIFLVFLAIETIFTTQIFNKKQ